MFAAEFDAHIGLAHHFAFEGRAVGHRHRHIRDLDLDAAHLDALLHQALGAFQVICAVDLIERHADHVLIGGDAGGQDFGDDRIGDDREAEVDRPGRGRVFQVVHFAQGQHKGKDAVLVVHQDVAGHAAFHTAEGQRGAGGKAQGIDGADRVGAERDGVGIVAQLDAFFDQLVDDAAPVDVAGQEAQDVALLQLAHDLDRDLVGFGAARRWRQSRACAHPPAGYPRSAAGYRRSGRSGGPPVCPRPPGHLRGR